MSDPGPAPPRPEHREHPEDEMIVRIATERLTVSVGRPAEIVEATVRTSSSSAALRPGSRRSCRSSPSGPPAAG